MVRDAGTNSSGTGYLNLTTDYTPDDLGRILVEKGPAHEIDLNGSATTLRTTQWTYYRDREDEVVRFSGYITVPPGSSSSSAAPVERIVGPVSITRTDEAPPPGAGYTGWNQRSQISAVYSGGGIPPESTNYDRDTWVRWSLSLSNKGGQRKESRLYWLIPGSSAPDPYGVASTNYGATLYGYDTAGRQDKVTTPGGTISKNLFNAMGWQTEAKTGTVALESQMVTTSRNEFDGNGNLTKATLIVDPANAALNRVTDSTYDWRNRRVELVALVEVRQGSADQWSLKTVLTYDNLNRVTLERNYHRLISGSSSSSSSSGGSAYTLNGKKVHYYDPRSRRYRTETYGVNPDTGTEGSHLTDNTYYDAGGNVIRSAPAGSQAFTVNAYDEVSRVIHTYTGYTPPGGSSSSSSSGSFDPGSVSGMIVVEQQDLGYDEAGNTIRTTSRQRFDDATGTGPLGYWNSTTQPKARVSYMAFYPDGIGRPLATGNYGTNANLTWTRPAVTPPRGDDILVSSTYYNPAGNAAEETDPMGTKTCREFDHADRVTTLIENCQHGGGSSSSSSSSSSSPAADVNRTSHYEYTDDSLLTRLKCDNVWTGQQVTTWEYGVTQAGGSKLDSSLLVIRKVYPETGSGSSSSSGTGSDRVVSYKYNAQRQVIQLTDQALTVHEYLYDKLGRLLTDKATIPGGSAVDATIGMLETEWEVRGLRQRAASYNTAGTTVLNEVKWEYNGFAQVTREYQEHAGAVNAAMTLHVDYAYADPGNNATLNTVRRTSITYPSSSGVSSSSGSAGLTTIVTAYEGEAANALSRPDALKESSTSLATYRYLGLATAVGVTYPAASGVAWSLDTTVSGVKDYTGLDRFDRLVETRWMKGSGFLVHSHYGRNRFGGVTWRYDDLAHSLGTTVGTQQDNYYWYDGLYQVSQHQRGTLNAYHTGINSPQQNEVFTYDAMGNWLGYEATGLSPAQTRTANKANEITSITNPGGPLTAPEYDACGNMTQMPLPADWASTGLLTWDAWDRLVKIEQSASGGALPLGTYTYDALTRRIASDSNADARHFYYDNEWRPVEERTDSSLQIVEREYIWGALSRWNLLRRRRNNGSGLAEPLFVLKDYLDPMAIVNSSGTVMERYSYDAFGLARFLDADFSSLPGKTNTWDWTFLFHAEFRDTETGLYNYGHRYYHPQLGRWLSRDPAGEFGGVNLFNAVGNNFINRIDLLGLWSTEVHDQMILDWLKSMGIGESIDCGCACTLDVAALLRSGSDYIDGVREYSYRMIEAQNPLNAFQHGMRAQGAFGRDLETVGEAQKKWEKFIADSVASSKLDASLGSAADPFNCLWLQKAITELGEAFHALSDSTSPLHRGFQPWNPFDVGKAKRHGNAGEGLAEYQKESENYRKATIDALNKYFEKTP